jgi:ribosomal protein L21E
LFESDVQLAWEACIVHPAVQFPLSHRQLLSLMHDAMSEYREAHVAVQDLVTSFQPHPDWAAQSGVVLSFSQDASHVAVRTFQVQRGSELHRPLSPYAELHFVRHVPVAAFQSQSAEKEHALEPYVAHGSMHVAAPA